MRADAHFETTIGDVAPYCAHAVKAVRSGMSASGRQWTNTKAKNSDDANQGFSKHRATVTTERTTVVCLSVSSAARNLARNSIEFAGISTDTQLCLMRPCHAGSQKSRIFGYHQVAHVMRG
jgi:hypothetical protein